MTDGQTLLLILILVYLSDCLIWVKRESVAFVSVWGGRWRLTVPTSWLGNANCAGKFSKCATAGQAKMLAQLIREIVKASTTKRTSIVRAWMQKQFAIEDAAARLEEGKAAIEP